MHIVLRLNSKSIRIVVVNSVGFMLALFFFTSKALTIKHKHSIIMSIRDGFEMCYFSSTEYNRLNNQSTVEYISPKTGRTEQ